MASGISRRSRTGKLEAGIEMPYAGTAMEMNEIERHGVGGQSPQPVQGVLAVPGGFVNVADGGLARQGGNGLIMRHEGLRGAFDHLLDRTEADRNVQDRLAEILNEAPGGAVHPRQFADESRQARPIAGLMLARYLGFESLATAGTLALLEDEMGDVHLDRW